MRKALAQATAHSIETAGDDQWRAYEWAADLVEISYRDKLDILIQIERFEDFSLGINRRSRVCGLVKCDLYSHGSPVIGRRRTTKVIVVFKDQDPMSGVREQCARRQPTEAGTNDNCVVAIMHGDAP